MLKNGYAKLYAFYDVLHNLP